MTSTKFKLLCFKAYHKETKRQYTEWEKIFVKCTSEKKTCTEYIKNYIQSVHTLYYRILLINNDDYGQADELNATCTF